MTQADSVHSTPPTNTSAIQAQSSRRTFLAQAAGVAAGGTALALATIPPEPAVGASVGPADSVFALIAAHKKIVGTVNATEDEIDRTVEVDKIIELEGGALAEQSSVEMDLFLALTEAVPTTLAGVVALVTHLDEVQKKDPWKFEDNYATPLIGALAVAFSRLAVAS
jgi:hypothetical protein